MLWLGVLLWFLGIVGCYTIARWRYDSFAAQLPDDPKERAERFWQWAVRERWRLGFFALPPIVITVVGMSIALLNLPSIWTMRLSILAWVMTFIGFAIVNHLAYLHLDRRLRGSTWSVSTYLRWLVTWHCWMSGMLISWLITLEVLRQVALTFPTEQAQPFWTVMILACSFGPFLTASGFLSRLLLRWELVRDEALLSLLCELAKRAQWKPPKLWQVNIPGGRIPLGMAMSRVIVISDFLRERLSHDEMRALFAHELAHLKFGHPRHRLLAMFGFLALETIAFALSPWRQIAATGALWLLVALLAFWFFVRWQFSWWRRQELQADKWAAQLVGDSELVAHMLEKLHILAFLPDAFPKGIKVTHPSLVQRLKALRQHL